MRRKIKNPWIGREHEGYNCFGCSPNNPIGLHLHFYAVDDNEIEAVWEEPNENHVGWIGVIHGGIQATLLDEAASWWVFYYRQVSGVTAKMEVSYKKQLLLADCPVRLRVKHVKDLRSYVVLHVDLYNAKEELCSCAEITYYQFSEEVSVRDFKFMKLELE